MIKILQVGRLGQWESIFSKAGSWSPQTEVCLILMSFSLACGQEPCHVLLWPFSLVCSFLMCSYPPTGSLVPLDRALKALFYINHLFKDLISKNSYSLKVLVVETSTNTWQEGIIQSIMSTVMGRHILPQLPLPVNSLLRPLHSGKAILAYSTEKHFGTSQSEAKLI